MYLSSTYISRDDNNSIKIYLHFDKAMVKSLLARMKHVQLPQHCILFVQKRG